MGKGQSYYQRKRGGGGGGGSSRSGRAKHILLKNQEKKLKKAPPEKVGQRGWELAQSRDGISKLGKGSPKFKSNEVDQGKQKT